MDAERVHVARGLAHHHLGEIVIVDIGAGRDADDRRRPPARGDEGLVAAVEVGGIFGPHVAAAAPAFVADAEIGNPPGLFAAVAPTLLGERRAAARGHVFEPLCHRSRRQRAHVAGDIGVGAEQLGIVHELVGAEAVVLDHAAPMDVDPGRPPVARADAVAPVIIVGEAAARPADHRHAEPPQRREHVVAIAVGVRDRRSLADPDAFVDAAAEMLGELAVDRRLDPRAGMFGVDGDRNPGRLRLRRSGREGDGGRGDREQYGFRIQHPASPFDGHSRPGLSSNGRTMVRRPSRKASAT